MEAYLVEVAKTNSPTLLICGGLIGLVYYLIKAQRDKTAVKRDSEKKDTDLQLALQAKDIENLKAQVAMQSSRWETLQDTLGKMNENLAAIRENISNLDARIDRLENK